MTYEIEQIPGKDKLFYRIHKSFLDPKNNQTITPGAFREQGDGDQRGMSMDWEKHSNARDSKERAKKPENNYIVSFVVDKLINGNLQVVHAPICEEIKGVFVDNRAHTNVKGLEDGDKNKIRLQLLEILNWEISPE